LVSELVKNVQEARVFNTICTSTQLRQEAALKLTREVDCMIVVGGKNSANTKRLVTLVMEKGVPAFHVETEKELKKDWFSGVSKAGVTGGASTPNWMIQRVIKGIRKLTDVRFVCKGARVKGVPI
jgi:4-hydroxy-3-methylbut-2-enyl diphosphate reductase